MADWRINEKYRKPRKAKGTPFYIQRNYYAAGVILVGGAFWYLYELWPESQKLKSKLDEKFKIPEGLEIKRKHIQASTFSGATEVLLSKARERELEKNEDKSKPQPWLSKLLTSEPET